jgi:hypothetical protein
MLVPMRPLAPCCTGWVQGSFYDVKRQPEKYTSNPKENHGDFD